MCCETIVFEFRFISIVTIVVDIALTLELVCIDLLKTLECLRCEFHQFFIVVVSTLEVHGEFVVDYSV